VQMCVRIDLAPESILSVRMQVSMSLVCESVCRVPAASLLCKNRSSSLFVCVRLSRSGEFCLQASNIPYSRSVYKHNKGLQIYYPPEYAFILFHINSLKIRSSPAQSILVRSPGILMTIFYCLKFETPPDLEY
jgi:hypothetical protein